MRTGESRREQLPPLPTATAPIVDSTRILSVPFIGLDGLESPAITQSRSSRPPEIISHAVWLYHRFTLSFRDVEDLLAERGVAVSYEAIRFWCRKFGPAYARTLPATTRSTRRHLSPTKMPEEPNRKT